MSGIQEFFASGKAAVAVAGGTVASGIAQILSWIPDSIGKFATLVGVVLTLVMISYWRAKTKKVQLESELLLHQIRKLKEDK